MTLDRFKVFVAAARLRSVTRAAEELHLSQPAVTKHLKALEKDCNAKLYKRTGRGIELTETGRALLSDVKAIVKPYERLKEKFGGAGSSGVETLSVGGSYSPSASLLPSLLANFKKSHPQVRINLRTDTRAAIDRMVLSSQVDVAIMNNVVSSRSLTLEPYRREPVVAFVYKNHSLARKSTLLWTDLEQAPFIIRKPLAGKGTGEQLLQSMREKGLKPNIVMRCNSPEAVKVAVKRKLGVGILYKETIEPELKRAEFKIIKLPVNNLDGQSFLVYRKDRPLSKTAQEFLKLLRERRQRPPGGQTNAKLPENLARDI